MKLVSIEGDTTPMLSCEITLDDRLTCESMDRHKLSVDLSFLNFDSNKWLHFTLSGEQNKAYF